MSTKFIGFDISKGTYNTPSGDAVPYDKRVLYLISDEGVKDTFHGYQPVDKQSIKLEVLAKSFKCPNSEVDIYLESCLGCECVITYGIVSGKPIVTGFSVKEEGGTKK